MNFDDFVKRRAVQGLGALVALGLPAMAAADVAFAEELVDNSEVDAFDIWTGDLDNDGFRDLVVVSRQLNRIVWYKNPGVANGTWQEFVVEDRFSGAITVSIGDVDKDGNLDIVAGGSTDGLSWFKNLGSPASGPFNWQEFPIDTRYTGVTSVFLADMDGDTKLDLVSSSGTLSNVRWYQNPADPRGAWRVTDVNTRFTGAYEVWAVENNGLMDIVGAARSSSRISWWPNPGVANVTSSRQWVEVVIDNRFVEAGAVVGADINKDGFQDFVGVAGGSLVGISEVTWWKNPGPATARNGNWESTVLTQDLPGAVNVDVGDFDLDGDMDIAAVAGGGTGVMWFENPAETGGAATEVPGQWTRTPLGTNLATSVSLAVADLDNDNDMDIAVVSAFLNRVLIFRNPTPPQVTGPSVVAGSVTRPMKVGGNYVFSFKIGSTPGVTYTVERSTDMVNWVVDQTVTGAAGTETTVNLSSADPKTYYRVR